MFGTSTLGGGTPFSNTNTATVNPMKDFEVASPPEDTVSALEFSPATLQQNFLIAGSWDSSVGLLRIFWMFFLYVSKLAVFCDLGQMLASWAKWPNGAKTNENYGRTGAGCLLVWCKFCRQAIGAFHQLYYYITLGWYKSLHSIVWQTSKMLGSGLGSSCTGCPARWACQNQSLGKRFELHVLDDRFLG